MRAYIPVLISIAVLNTAGQLLIKKGAAAISEIPAGEIGRAVTALASSLWIWGGLFLYAFSLAGWLYVLSRVELSFAYPFLSLSYVLVLAWGAFFLGEGVNAWRVGGVVLICAGLVCISRSAPL